MACHCATVTDINITKILQAQISDIALTEARQRQAEAAALESVRQVASELASAAARALYPDPLLPDARKVQVSVCVKENSFPTALGLPATWRLATGVDVMLGTDISFVAAIDAEPVSTANASLLTLRRRENSWMVVNSTNATQWYNDATSAMRAIFTRPAEAERIARVLRTLAKSGKTGA